MKLSEIILCIIVIESKQYVGLILFLSKSSVNDLFLSVFKVSSGNVVYLL